MSRIFSRLRWVVVAIGVVALLTGCSDDVRVYDVPHEKQRLVAAIALVGDDAWIFKLMGDAEAVGKNRDTFVTFLRSLRFPADSTEPSWVVPDGWKYEKGKELRFATFRIPDGLEVTVFKFARDGGQALANVNRWRGQLKLRPLRSNEELKSLAQHEKLADGHEAMVVDMDNARRPAADKSSKPITYQGPKGWKELPATDFTMGGFELVQDGKKVTLTVSKAGGDVTANVNRWRGQVGLPSASADDIERSSTAMDVSGTKSLFVDLAGEKQRILAVMSPTGEQSWFFKMIGPTEMVEQQKSAFEAFVRSVRFGGGE